MKLDILALLIKLTKKILVKLETLQAAEIERQLTVRKSTPLVTKCETTFKIDGRSFTCTTLVLNRQGTLADAIKFGGFNIPMPNFKTSSSYTLEAGQPGFEEQIMTYLRVNGLLLPLEVVQALDKKGSQKIKSVISPDGIVGRSADVYITETVGQLEPYLPGKDKSSPVFAHSAEYFSHTLFFSPWDAGTKVFLHLVNTDRA